MESIIFNLIKKIIYQKLKINLKQNQNKFNINLKLNLENQHEYYKLFIENY